jgi:CheY-like chemotaxis protein
MRCVVCVVDDRPANNLSKRQALEVLDIRFTLSPDTTDALEKLRLNQYDVIISDMTRGSERLAGYTLLEEKKKLGDHTPVIFYPARSNCILWRCY